MRVSERRWKLRMMINQKTNSDKYRSQSKSWKQMIVFNNKMKFTPKMK